MRICGIDPGTKGGISVVDENLGLVRSVRVPIVTLKKRKLVDVGLLQQSRLLDDVDLVVIENVWARGGQNVRGVVSFMTALGALYGWAAAQKHVEWVVPQIWKKHFGLIGQSKDASLEQARLYWPEQADTTFKYKLDTDRAEAALIARWYAETRAETDKQLAAILARDNLKVR